MHTETRTVLVPTVIVIITLFLIIWFLNLTTPWIEWERIGGVILFFIFVVVAGYLGHRKAKKEIKEGKGLKITKRDLKILAISLVVFILIWVIAVLVIG